MLRRFCILSAALIWFSAGSPPAVPDPGTPLAVVDAAVKIARVPARTGKIKNKTKSLFSNALVPNRFSIFFSCPPSGGQEKKCI